MKIRLALEKSCQRQRIWFSICHPLKNACEMSSRPWTQVDNVKYVQCQQLKKHFGNLLMNNSLWRGKRKKSSFLASLRTVTFDRNREWNPLPSAASLVSDHPILCSLPSNFCRLIKEHWSNSDRLNRWSTDPWLVRKSSWVISQFCYYRLKCLLRK